MDDAGDGLEAGTGPGDPGGEPLLAGEDVAADQGRGAAAVHQQRRDLRRQAERVFGDEEVAGGDPPERRGVDRFGFGSHDMPGRKALHSLCLRPGDIKRERRGSFCSRRAHHAQHAFERRLGVELASTRTQRFPVSLRQRLQHRADDLDALDRVDAEVRLEALVEADHVARIAGLFLDDGEQHVGQLVAAQHGCGRLVRGLGGDARAVRSPGPPGSAIRSLRSAPGRALIHSCGSRRCCRSTQAQERPPAASHRLRRPGGPRSLRARALPEPRPQEPPHTWAEPSRFAVAAGRGRCRRRRRSCRPP